MYPVNRKEKLLVILRDGRKLVGLLRSYDQFANFVLQETVERIYYRNQFSDIPRGVFLVRGENVVFCGEIDPQLELQDRIRLGIRPVPVEEILVRQREDTIERDHLARARERLLQSHGFINEMETEQF
jgi:U6 snRNA-associated Sm-like protein LSm1